MSKFPIVYQQLWHASRSSYGCFLKWWYPPNTPKWSSLVGKPMVVGYHHFWKHPYLIFFSGRLWEFLQATLGSTTAYRCNGWNQLCQVSATPRLQDDSRFLLYNLGYLIYIQWRMMMGERIVVDVTWREFLNYVRLFLQCWWWNRLFNLFTYDCIFTTRSRKAGYPRSTAGVKAMPQRCRSKCQRWGRKEHDL